MEVPTQEQVAEFLDKETFKVTLDPDLTDLERRKVLRNLTKAREEAEMDTTPGAFHAWKNLMHRVVDKMKMLTKPLLAGGTALLLAGCVGGGGVLSPTNEPLSQPTSSSSESSSAAGVAICSTMTEDQVDALGDAYPAGLVTDQYGEYCKLTINPASKALEHDPASVDPSVFEHGFTEEEAFAAQDAGVKWIVENFLDSSVLDGAHPEGVTADEWTREHAGLNVEEWEQYGPVYIWAGAPVLNGFKTPFERSGIPRTASINISDVKLSAFTAESGKETLIVSVSASTTYNTKDVQVIELLENYMSPATDEEVITDGVDGVLEIEFTKLKVGYLKDVSNGVAGWMFNADFLLDQTKVN